MQYTETPFCFRKAGARQADPIPRSKKSATAGIAYLALILVTAKRINAKVIKARKIKVIGCAMGSRTARIAAPRSTTYKAKLPRILQSNAVCGSKSVRALRGSKSEITGDKIMVAGTDSTDVSPNAMAISKSNPRLATMPTNNAVTTPPSRRVIPVGMESLCILMKKCS